MVHVDMMSRLAEYVRGQSSPVKGINPVSPISSGVMVSVTVLMDQMKSAVKAVVPGCNLDAKTLVVYSLGLAVMEALTARTTVMS